MRSSSPSSATPSTGPTRPSCTSSATAGRRSSTSAKPCAWRTSGSGTGGSTSGTTGGWAIIRPAGPLLSALRPGQDQGLSVSGFQDQPRRGAPGPIPVPRGRRVLHPRCVDRDTTTPASRRAQAAPASAGPPGAASGVPRGHPEARALLDRDLSRWISGRPGGRSGGHEFDPTRPGVGIAIERTGMAGVGDIGPAERPPEWPRT